MKTTLNRYIFTELWPPFGINLAFFSFIFLMTQLLEITNLIVNYQIRVIDVILVLAYNMPFFLQFIIPMAVMVAVLLTFVRMSGDKEIVALKAGGISIYALMPPVIIFGLIGCLLTALVAIYALPHGRQAAKRLLYDLAAAHLDIGLKPRQFIDNFKDLILYIHQIDTADKSLKDVFIEDRRSPKIITTVVAPRGRIAFQPEARVVHLRLFNGTIHQVDVAHGAANALTFDSYDIRLDMANSLSKVGQGSKDEEEMTLIELRDYIKSAKVRNDRYYLALMEWHKKFALPLACVTLALLGMPLGIQARLSKRSYGIGLGLAFFLFYYFMLSIGWVFGETGVYPPFIGMWMPNLVTGLIGIVLLVRAAREKPLPWPPVGRWWRRVAGRRRCCPVEPRSNRSC